MTRDEAKLLRALIEQASESLPDKEASQGAVLFPRLKGKGALVKAGTRINWRGVVKRAAVDLWDTAENNPDNAPTLWEDISYVNGYRVIPEVITVTTAFAKGEQGWFEDGVWESLQDNNVWNPKQFAAGWKKIQ